MLENEKQLSDIEYEKSNEKNIVVDSLTCKLLRIQQILLLTSQLVLQIIDIQKKILKNSLLLKMDNKKNILYNKPYVDFRNTTE